ncbi:MAG: hypothetical protein ACOYT4_03110, partial [Nanoarchaeota archaeon]
QLKKQLRKMRKTLDKIILSGFVLMCLNYGNVREAYCARPPQDASVILIWSHDPNQSCGSDGEIYFCNKDVIKYKIYTFNNSFQEFTEDVRKGRNIPIEVFKYDVCQEGKCEYIVTGLDPSVRHKFVVTANDKIGWETGYSNIASSQESENNSKNPDENYVNPNSPVQHNLSDASQSGCFLLTIKKTTEKNEKNIR